MQKSPPLTELTSRQVQWILGGAAMMLATLPGQTVFVAQFNSALRAEYGLSHGEFGGLYTLATLASAFSLVWAGVLADRVSAQRLAAASVLGLAGMGVLIAPQHHVVLLGLALIGLRFFGQGMLGHVAATTMSRWFNRFRGRALSFSGLGYTAGEAATPYFITVAVVAFGWRSVWLATAVVLVAVIGPVIWFLLRDPPDGKRAAAAGRTNPDAMPAGALTGAQWGRGAVIRDPLFWSIVPAIMGSPAIGTLFIFHQAHLVAIKGWDLTVFTAAYPLLSLSVVLSAIAAGFLVDRLGAWRVLPLGLLPLMLGCLAIALFSHAWTIPFLLILFGMASGLMSPVVGALWAEVYGTAHIGAIRSLAIAAMVAASALGPGIAGYLIDAGIDLGTQSFGYAAYALASAGLAFALRRRFSQRVEALLVPAA